MIEVSYQKVGDYSIKLKIDDYQSYLFTKLDALVLAMKLIEGVKDAIEKEGGIE